MTDRELLALHARLVGIRSDSGGGRDIATYLAEYLTGCGCLVEAVGCNLLVFPRPPAPGEPLLVLDSHLDTVPPAAGWTRDPWSTGRAGERIYGLGSNDAKASVATMISAALDTRGAGASLALCLAADEETSNRGSAALLERLRDHCLEPRAVLVGEPTALDLAVAQKGLMVLELVATGSPSHAAHRRALGVANPLFDLARDLAALEGFDGGEPHPLLGPVTIEPTVIRGGAARNTVPGEAACILDVRTNPSPAPEELLSRMRRAVRGELRCLSDRLRPQAVDPGASIVRAALAARPQARLIGSSTLSDTVVFCGIPTLKVGPGDTCRSHSADEYVCVSELREGARFYSRVVECFAAICREEECQCDSGNAANPSTR